MLAQAAPVAVRGTAHTHPDHPGPASETHHIAAIQLPTAEARAR
ncbi:hypothetical protein [Streptomyces venetus]